MRIRKLNETEIGAALKLIWDTFLQFEAPDYPQEGIDAFRKFISDPETVSGLEFFGAFIRHTLRGVVATRTQRSHICSFFVDAAFQKQGVGRGLWEAVEACSGAKSITVNASVHAVEFYRKMGFIDTACAQQTDGIRYIPMEYRKAKDFLLQTERLYLREMTQSDYGALCKMLQDPDVMYAYAHAFDDREAQEWLDRQLARYAAYGFGLWAVLLKENKEMIGQCGLTLQDYRGSAVPEIGYLFQKAYWHKGYATEAAVACKKYAFEILKMEEVFSIIRDTNTASQRVARRNGMTVKDQFVKHYYGIDMPHLVFSVENPE